MVGNYNMMQFGGLGMNNWMMNPAMMNPSMLGSINGYGPTSIFGPNEDLTQYSMNAPFLGGGCGFPSFGGGMYGMTLLDQQKYGEIMEDKMIDRQATRAHRIEAAQFKTKAAEEASTRQAFNLKAAIEKGEGKIITQQYDELLRLTREKLEETMGKVAAKDVTPEQIKANAETFYHEKTGSSLLADVSKSGYSPFAKGLLDGTGIGLLLTGTDDTADLQYKLTGVEKTTGEKAARIAGTVISGALTLFGTYLGCKGLSKLLSSKAAAKVATETAA